MIALFLLMWFLLTYSCSWKSAGINCDTDVSALCGVSTAHQYGVVLGCVGSLHGTQHYSKSESYSAFYQISQLVIFCLTSLCLFVLGVLQYIVQCWHCTMLLLGFDCPL